MDIFYLCHIRKQTLPAMVEGVPVVRQRVSDGGRGASGVGESAMAEGVPVVGERESVMVEGVPVVRERESAIVEGVPVVRERESAIVEGVPEVRESILCRMRMQLWYVCILH